MELWAWLLGVTSHLAGCMASASPSLKQEDNLQYKGHAESLSPSLFYKPP